MYEEWKENGQENTNKQTAGEQSGQSAYTYTADEQQTAGDTAYTYTAGEQQTTGDTAYSYSAPQAETVEPGVGFGIASLVLGIISLVLFCSCINIPFAILAIIFGIIQLVRGSGKGLAIGGLITSILSIIALVVFWVVVGVHTPKLSDMSDIDSFMEEYQREYNQYYDDFENDFHSDDDDDTF